MIMDKIALILAIIGGLNWGSIGIFGFDLVAFAFGGSGSAVSRVVYTLVGLAAVWCISLCFGNGIPWTKKPEYPEERTRYGTLIPQRVRSIFHTPFWLVALGSSYKPAVKMLEAGGSARNAAASLTPYPNHA